MTTQFSALPDSGARVDTDQIAVARGATTVRMDMLELLADLLSSIMVDAATLTGDGVNTNLAVATPLTTTLLAKLNAIEANATADQTAAEILTLLLTVDGTGSGLDADLLDGLTPAEVAALGGGGGGSSTWLDLTDTPSAFGTAGQVSAVNAPLRTAWSSLTRPAAAVAPTTKRPAKCLLTPPGSLAILAAADTDVQAALDTIDGFTLGGGGGGTPQALSRFEAVTTANTTAQALSATYADILEIATTDIFANVGGFTVATVSNISTITVPNNGLFKVTCHIKAATTGSARAVLYLRANVLRSGVAVANTATIMGGSYLRNFSNARTAILSGTTTLLLETGDTITFQMAEEANTGSTYTIGGADSVVEIVEIPSEAFAGADGAATFLALTDTPSALGTTGQVPAVNTAGDALEFVDQTGGGGGGTDDQNR